MVRRSQRCDELGLLASKPLEAVQAELDAEYQTRIGRSTASSRPKVSSTQGLDHVTGQAIAELEELRS
jgi:hypothetical protein